ncbi:helix-turn-helix domain-containing protein [Myroides odoratimimus]|uniref:helix-turn-helix domain-containing protein n=1 Tax=Myroides odoratimimus TaxID=76832 RepID=UPI0031010581
MENKNIPIYNICNLLGDDNILQDCVVYRLEEYISDRPAMVSSPHRHAFYQVLFISEGEGLHSIDFEKFSIEEYRLFFLSPAQVHKWEFGPETKGFLINFNENFLRTFLVNPNYLNEFSCFNGSVEYSKFSCENCSEEFQNKFEKIYNAYLEKHALHEDFMRILMLELFLDTQLFLVNKMGIIEEHCDNTVAYFIIKNFEKLIEEHFLDKRLPTEYAEILHISSNHLNVLCKKVLGVTAGEVIRNRIVLECKRLLINADLSITAIAYELNFKNNAYFSRFFKKNTGLTPDEFRKQN